MFFRACGVTLIPMLAGAKRVMALVGWVALSAGAVLAAVASEGAGRTAAIGFALIVVIGYPAIRMMGRLSRPRTQAIRREVIRFGGTHREALVCHYSRQKQRAAFVGSCAIAIGCVLLFTSADAIADDSGSRWLLRGASFGLAVLFAIRAAADIYRRWGSGHYVALLPEGMLHQAIRPIFVPWSAVETAGVFEWQRTKGTGVRLRQSSEVQAPWWVRRNMSSNRRLFGFDLIVVEFEAAPEELAEAIQGQFLASVDGSTNLRRPCTASQPSG